MIFVLKNRQAYKALCDAFPDFAERFDNAASAAFNRNFPQAACTFSVGRVSICVPMDEIEPACDKAYSPTKWNDYPAVNPPQGVWMQVELETTGITSKTVRTAAVYINGAWRDESGTPISHLAYSQRVVKRFKPWSA